MQSKDVVHKHKDKAQVTLMLWLGLIKDYKEIQQIVSKYGGELTTYMEIVSS